MPHTVGLETFKKRKFFCQYPELNHNSCHSAHILVTSPPSPPMALWPNVRHGLLILEVSWSHTMTHITVDRTPLYEWSVRRRDLYLTTHNTHNRQTSMPLVGFEPTISAGKQPHAHALEHTATGTGILVTTPASIYFNFTIKSNFS